VWCRAGIYCRIDGISRSRDTARGARKRGGVGRGEGCGGVSVMGR
jgi:hypothetical protein